MSVIQTIPDLESGLVARRGAVHQVLLTISQEDSAGCYVGVAFGKILRIVHDA
jgi:hypothetical protein